MRKGVCILPGLLILLLGGGCSLFREVLVSRRDSSYTGSVKQSLDWKVDSLHSAVRVFTYTDSSGAEFDVEIVPSGNFTFSAQGGFSGSASLLRFRGATQTNSKGVDSSMENMQIRSSGSLKENVKTKTATTQKETTKKENNSFLWIYTLMAVLTLFGVVAYKIYRMYR